MHGHAFSSALLIDFYLSTPRAAGRSAHEHLCVAVGVLLRGRRAPRAGGSQAGRVTRMRRRWCDAREKEVA